jgi:hypothetical protein
MAKNHRLFDHELTYAACYPVMHIGAADASDVDLDEDIVR